MKNQNYNRHNDYALNNIEDILGNRSKVNLSEEIFSRFCLGK